MRFIGKFALLLVASTLTPAWASKVRTTPQELKSMEPVCRTIGMGEVDGKFWAEVLMNSPVLDQPENAMAKGAGWLHHYCWGKLAKFRYYSARTAAQRGSAIWNWRSEMKFIVDWTGERGIKWTYMPVIHKEIAESYLFEKKYAQAIAEGEKALALDKDYIPVYLVISDAYAGANKRGKALEIVAEGLKRAPESRPLKRRYSDFGGKPPYPVPYVKEALAPEAVSAPQSAPEQPQPDSPPASKAAADTGDSEKAMDAQPINDEPKKTGGNPYCRFCP